jgi:hypothetical protein
MHSITSQLTNPVHQINLQVILREDHKPCQAQTSAPEVHLKTINYTPLTPSTMSVPAAVTDYQKERTNFLSWLEDQARLIRLQPKSDTIAEVKVNLRERSGEYLDRLTEASILMACETSDNIYVTVKPKWFYNDMVPKICGLLQIRIPQIAMRLGINPKCDMCVHYIIMNIVAEPGF